MMSTPETSSPAPPASQRWLWAVRIATLVPVISALVYILAAPVPMWVIPCYEDSLPLGVFLLILVSPYALGLKGLWGRKLKQGLAWAGIAGAFWGPVLLLFAVGAFAGDGTALGLLALLVAATQVTLVVSAIKTFRSLEREKGQRRIIWLRVFLFVLYLPIVLLGVLALPPTLRGRGGGIAWEAEAVGSLRMIVRAQTTYKETYGKGYSPSLLSLGPPAPGASPSASAAGLIDEQLARGVTRKYRFLYTPGPVDSTGRVDTYTLTAGPSSAACVEWRRFFDDETGVIRWTRENRAANAQDPPLGEGEP